MPVRLLPKINWLPESNIGGQTPAFAGGLLPNSMRGECLSLCIRPLQIWVRAGGGISAALEVQPQTPKPGKYR